MNLSSILEAILVASAQPLSAHDLACNIRARASSAHDRLIQNHGDDISTENTDIKQFQSNQFLRSADLNILAELSRIDSREVTLALNDLQCEYQQQNRGFILQEVTKGWQIVARVDLSDFITQEDTQVKKLPNALLECLAMIAYKQPLSKTAIESVRGVASATPLQKLQELGLIASAGVSDLPGNQPLFITTKEFLDYFGIPNLDALPKVAELRIAPLEAGLETI